MGMVQRVCGRTSRSPERKEMLRIDNIKMPVSHKEADIVRKIAQTTGVSVNEISGIHIVRRSLDARKKPDIFYVYSIAFSVKNEGKVLKRCKGKNVTLYQPVTYKFPGLPANKKVDSENVLLHPPVIIGAGPAGLFCAYELALAGYKPVVFERGKKVEERQKDVEAFFEKGVLNPLSNIQFGEGGAGTFSDGKLNTLVKDPIGRNRHVLETFVEFGAKESILYDNKPHIGTDVLITILKRLREKIIEAGGTFCFESQVTKLCYDKDGLNGVKLQDGTIVPTRVAVLAVGHSARDTFSYLATTPIEMEAKAFAVGFRVEHLQSTINQSQYGMEDEALPAAAYKLTAKTENGRGVYTFCMCPGGYVVNASSLPGHTCVNGMSYSDRGGKNANSAVIVAVSPEDYEGTDALAGVRFQEKLETMTYELGQGKIPQQCYGDYKEKRRTTGYGSIVSQTKGETCFAPLHDLLPKPLRDSFIEGMEHFGRQIKGFNGEDVVLSGIESRTSSPVRITRNEEFESNILGVYPCGEGAGYAGGIMSAAMDGIKVAEAIGKKYEIRG